MSSFKSGYTCYGKKYIKELLYLGLINADMLQESVATCDTTIKLNAAHLIADIAAEAQGNSNIIYNKIYEACMSMNSKSLFIIYRLMKKGMKNEIC